MSEINYKLVLVGNYDTGKTSLFNKIKNGLNPSQNNINTLGLDRISIDLNLNIKKNGVKVNQPFNLNIFDTAGKKRFISLTKINFRRGDGFLLMYDITNRESFDDIEMWVNIIKEEINELCKYVMILIGYTSNVWVEYKERKVTEEEGYEKCEKLNLIWGGEHDIKNMCFDDIKKLINVYVKAIHDVIAGETIENINKIIKLGKVKKEKNSCVSKKK